MCISNILDRRIALDPLFSQECEFMLDVFNVKRKYEMRDTCFVTTAATNWSCCFLCIIIGVD